MSKKSNNTQVMSLNQKAKLFVIECEKLIIDQHSKKCQVVLTAINKIPKDVLKALAEHTDYTYSRPVIKGHVSISAYVNLETASKDERIIAWSDKVNEIWIANSNLPEARFLAKGCETLHLKAMKFLERGGSVDEPLAFYEHIISEE